MLRLFYPLRRPHPIIPLRLSLEPKTEGQVGVVHIDIYVCTESMVMHAPLRHPELESKFPNCRTPTEISDLNLSK